MCKTLQLRVGGGRHALLSWLLIPSDSGEDYISGRALCKAYQHFFSWPSRGHGILCCFSTFHPLVFSYISSVRLSLNNLFSCLLIPRLPFPPSLSHGVSSSVLYQPFIIFHAPQIILPSLWLLNDHKMHLCARHLRCSQALRALFFFFISFFAILAAVLLHPPENAWQKKKYPRLVITGSGTKHFKNAARKDTRKINSQTHIVGHSPPRCSTWRRHSFETGAIRSDKAVGEPRGFP